MGRHSPTCRARVCRSSVFISRCTRTGRARWKGTTTATTGPIVPSRIRTARRLSRPRGRSPRILQDKQWNETLFQGFLNNKNNFKANGWSRGSSPWLLDEPASFQDFWALRYFARAFHEGINQAAKRQLRGQSVLAAAAGLPRRYLPPAVAPGQPGRPARLSCGRQCDA